MATPEIDPKTKSMREDAQKLLASDYFNALGVSRTASPDEVKRAFIETAKTWHPDRVPQGLDELKPLFGKVFARLELARATVSDPARRARYIEELARPAAAAGDGASEAAVEYKKAEILLKKNDEVQAMKHLHRALQLAPANVEYQTLLVWLQAKPDSTIERLRELVGELDKLIKKDNLNDRTYFYRAMLRKRLGLTKEAFSDFSRAADLNPKNVDAVREVRLHNMRKERDAGTGDAQKNDASADDDGPLGFFKKLFKR